MRTLDVDGRRPTELDGDAVVVFQRRLDDLLLHLAVERDRDLLGVVVLPDVDQRVLLGELRERDAERVRLVRVERRDDRLQRWRCEVMPDIGMRSSNHVADPHLSQAPELPDLARGH